MEKRDDTTPQVRSRALMQESAAAIPPLTQVCGVEPLCRKRKRCRQRSNFRSPASQAMALLLELSGSAQPCLRGRGGPFGFNPLQLRPSYLRMPQSCRLRVCTARFNVMTIRGCPTSSANIILRTWRSFWATCHCYTDPLPETPSLTPPAQHTGRAESSSADDGYSRSLQLWPPGPWSLV